MIVIEMTAMSSQVKDAYWKKYLDVTPKFLTKLVKAMFDKGIYSNNFNIEFVTSSIFSLIMGPIIFKSSKILNISDRFSIEEMVDQISRFADIALGAQKAAE
jgi:hypothetical protein